MYRTGKAMELARLFRVKIDTYSTRFQFSKANVNNNLENRRKMNKPRRFKRLVALRFASTMIVVLVPICLFCYYFNVHNSKEEIVVLRKRILRAGAAALNSKQTKHESDGQKPKSPSPSPSPSPRLTPMRSPVSSLSRAASPSKETVLTSSTSRPSSNSSNLHWILLGTIGVSAAIVVSVIFIIFWKSRTAAVKPWITGLSGQLQRRFLTGVPKLKRSDLETACEDFCNVIGSSSCGSVFKGTLSDGVEIAVVSIPVQSSKEWSKGFESMLRKKVDSLSKINHKNFVNLLGYCEEADPFARMLVFEYAPNGTLYEHLHYEEAEPLDWEMRLRIAVGIANCLEHMHQLKPPIAHNDLNSSIVNLTEDYAAKVSDFSFRRESDSLCSDELGFLKPQKASIESNVYNFGVILLEMITGALPSDDDMFIQDYMESDRRILVDQSLNSFSEDQLEAIGDVIAACVDRNPNQRPTMREVAARLREITGIGPERAIPKLSPLWWAELEILSVEAS